MDSCEENACAQEWSFLVDNPDRFLNYWKRHADFVECYYILCEKGNGELFFFGEMRFLCEQKYKNLIKLWQPGTVLTPTKQYGEHEDWPVKRNYLGGPYYLRNQENLSEYLQHDMSRPENYSCNCNCSCCSEESYEELSDSEEDVESEEDFSRYKMNKMKEIY